MQRSTQGQWPARLGAFGVALALGAGVAYWVLHWPTAQTAPMAGATPSELPAANAAGLAKLLGATAPAVREAAPPTTDRFQLIGVVSRSGGGGSAVIALDGKPAKSYAVGSTLEPGLVLRSVAPRKAMLAPAMDQPPTRTLEMPSPLTK